MTSFKIRGKIIRAISLNFIKDLFSTQDAILSQVKTKNSPAGHICSMSFSLESLLLHE